MKKIKIAFMMTFLVTLSVLQPFELVAPLTLVGKAAETFDIVESKQNLAKMHEDKRQNLSEKEIEIRSKKIENLLNTMQVKGSTKEQLIQVVENLGLVELKTPEQSKIEPFSQGNDVTMRTPVIFYDQFTSNWYVTASGIWSNNNWFQDLPKGWIGYKGETKNIGQRDAIGITYYNTSGTYNTAVTSSSAVISDGKSWSETYNNPSHGNGRHGIAFEIQDKARLNKTVLIGGVNDLDFLGKSFALSVTYNPSFANYHGRARLLYAHTWSSAVIDSITFGISSKQFGADIKISNIGNSFQIFNGVDRIF